MKTTLFTLSYQTTHHRQVGRLLGWIVGFATLLPTPIWAQTKEKIDLKKIEEQYWSAKDTDFSVVQNRAFPKESRFFASYSLGNLMNDPFISGATQRLSIGYYFSERWGLEIGQENFNPQDNKATQFFKNQPSPIYPNYNRIESHQSLSVLFVPFYAKMSFLDRKILYFDMQIGFGLGQKNYSLFMQNGNHETQSNLGYHLDITQNIFIHQNVAFRVDFKNQWHNQNRKNSGNGQSLGSEMVNDALLLLGINLFY